MGVITCVLPTWFQFHSFSKKKMDGCRLLVRKLPSFLRSEEKESLLKYFGAVEVTVMAEKGMMVRNFYFEDFHY